MPTVAQGDTSVIQTEKWVRRERFPPLHARPATALALRVLKRINQSPKTKHVFDTLAHATSGDVYLVGGAIRRVLLGNGANGDLDFMVPNNDSRAFDALSALGVPFSLNRSGHHRYQWDGLQVELFPPATFYSGFADVESAVRYFDLRVNALALHAGSRSIIDPFRISRQKPTDPGINWRRWEVMPDLEITILAIRFLRIMCDNMTLTIGANDARRLRQRVVPAIRRCEWSPVHDRYPQGKELFIRDLETLVQQRTLSDR
jgi:hypothetical protein